MFEPDAILVHPAEFLVDACLDQQTVCECVEQAPTEQLLDTSVVDVGNLDLVEESLQDVAETHGQTHSTGHPDVLGEQLLYGLDGLEVVIPHQLRQVREQQLFVLLQLLLDD